MGALVLLQEYAFLRINHSTPLHRNWVDKELQPSVSLYKWRATALKVYKFYEQAKLDVEVGTGSKAMKGQILVEAELA